MTVALSVVFVFVALVARMFELRLWRCFIVDGTIAADNWLWFYGCFRHQRALLLFLLFLYVDVQHTITALCVKSGPGWDGTSKCGMLTVVVFWGFGAKKGW